MGLEEITVESLEWESDGGGHAIEGEPNSSRRVNAKRRRYKKRRNTKDSNNFENGASDEDPGKVPKGGEVAAESWKLGDSQGQGMRPTPEDFRSRFYGDYCKVVDEYDKEFNKRYSEDLNTTLIFAGLFSAVTSAFIIEVNSQLQLDPNAETHQQIRETPAYRCTRDISAII